MTINYRTRNIVIAAALAAAAVLLTVIYVTSANKDEEAGKQSVTVYVAGKNFAVGTSGSKVAGALRKESVQRRLAAPDFVTNPQQLQGLVVTQPVYAGEQVTLKRFATPQEQGIRTQLQGKLRAIQVAGTKNQVLAGTLQAGDRVDVLAAFKPSTVSREVASVILRDLKVLETDTPDDGSAVGSADDNAVLLALTDEQAQRLFFAVKHGEWWLQLRPVKKPTDSAPATETATSVLRGGK
jgi:Flp pilus assembly protein CpaB